jgi:hypothetical protein
VLQIDKRYYAVDNGVWFTSAAASGPWAVADSIPSEEIQKIPPSSPVYNTTNVHIYESTPEVVYVGYTPGYMWSFPHYGVPVYGTGWRYPPYYGNFYYPRPPTWGFTIGYNPWTGWNFGMSWSNGFFSFGMSWGGGYPGMYRPWGCCNGWYGGGHRGPTIINTGDINIGNNINIGNRTTVRNRIDNNNKLNVNNARNNIYNRPENRNRVADRATARSNLKQARPAGNRANNVFADRDGNVARNVGDSWEGRENGQWTKDSVSPATRDQVSSAVQQRAPAETKQRPQTTAQSRNVDRSSLNRASTARQHGASREAARPRNMRRPAGRRR